MLIFANHYYNFGFNVTHISTNRNKFHKTGETILKSPSHSWGEYLHKRQSLDELHCFDWLKASGIGTVLGYNLLRALDVDECTDFEIIDDFLELLGLPKDYQWVTLSGSKKGFHIIFYSKPHRYKTEKGKIKAFKSNHAFSSKFKHIELRWFGHLVLPPSLHPSLNNYVFRNKINPSEKPKVIEIDSLHHLIVKYCSDRLLEIGSHSGVYIDETEYKIIEESLLTSDSYIDTNYELIEESNDRSCVFIDTVGNPPYYFFFDTETTGVPLNWKAPVSNLTNWPRIVQIAYIIYDENGFEIENENYIIKPEGYTIPIEASNIHGITTETAIQNGKSLNLVVDKIYDAINNSKCLVAHNINFDAKVLGAEFLRNNKPNIIEAKTKICTMESSTDFCAIEGHYGNKWPKLSELYYKLFDCYFEEAHDALFDIKATAKCFWELKRMGRV